MKKTILALAAASALGALPTASFADDMFSFNVGAVTDYRYRGISQTRLDPALQGGVDVALPAGFYVGTWLSSIKWIKDLGGDASVEWDLYGGYKGEISKDLTYDVGVLRYQYPSNNLDPSTNTTEIYGALTYGPVTAKYSHSVTNLFGFADSKNSGYLDLSAGFDIGNGFTLAPHVGWQEVHHNSQASYMDGSLTVSKEVIKGLVLSVAGVVNDTKGSTYVSPDGHYLGKSGLVFGAKYTF
jgi:uncharacterized protein (TIGR02001 family)